MAEPPDNSQAKSSVSSSPPTGGGVIIDMGTGDGLFVYQCARANPDKFYIGIDANPRPLEKVSEKIHRRPAKGGLPNALFLKSSLEELPEELDGVADELHVHFPWGSLLKAVATGERAALLKLRRVCAEGALLEVVIGLDPSRDRSEIGRLGLSPLSREYIDSVLAPGYGAAGFLITESGTLPPSAWSGLRTSWAKRLKGGAGRSLTYIVARAV